MSINPVTSLEFNGRRVRHCKASVSRTTVRTDGEAEYALKFAKEALKGSIPGDVPSASMIIRRALALYRIRLASDMRSPDDLKAECTAIRHGSVMPKIRKHLP